MSAIDEIIFAVKHLQAVLEKHGLEFREKHGAAFRELAAAHGVGLPLTAGEDGCIVDANGDVIATVDVLREMPDSRVEMIAALLVRAVNTCGGFRAEERADG